MPSRSHDIPENERRVADAKRDPKVRTAVSRMESEGGPPPPVADVRPLTAREKRALAASRDAERAVSEEPDTLDLDMEPVLGARNEGEGSRTADRNYRAGATRTATSPTLEKRARDAEESLSTEREELDDAVQRSKRGPRPS